MGSSILHSLSGEAWCLAEQQHGVVARRQLLELGLSSQAIQHRLSKGRLHRVERGVYSVGRPELNRRGRWMAAVLACGSRAVLSHRSAAALWGIGTELPNWIEISVPVTSVRKRDRVRVHRRPNLRSSDVTVRDGIPVTNPVRTLIDIARRLDPPRLERAINEADRLDLVDPERLFAALEDYTGQLGVGPHLALVVEADGLRYHRTPAQHGRDRLRDQTHAAAGMTALRFTHEQVRFEARWVRDAQGGRCSTRRGVDGLTPRCRGGRASGPHGLSSRSMSPLPSTARIREVGPRDGFQNEPETIPSAEKVRLIDLLSSSGLRRLEGASFVRPDVIPQLSDAEEVLAAVQRRDGVAFSVLIPNERGLERALGFRDRF